MNLARMCQVAHHAAQKWRKNDRKPIASQPQQARVADLPWKQTWSVHQQCDVNRFVDATLVLSHHTQNACHVWLLCWEIATKENAHAPSFLHFFKSISGYFTKLKRWLMLDYENEIENSPKSYGWYGRYPQNFGVNPFTNIYLSTWFPKRFLTFTQDFGTSKSSDSPGKLGFWAVKKRETKKKKGRPVVERWFSSISKRWNK